jgi:hypothetical protein
MHVKVFHFKTLHVKYWVHLSVLKFDDTWYGRKLRHVCALGKAHIDTQATQPMQGRAAQISVIHTFECVSAS